GYAVKKGQLLAVIWSKELGQKKGALLDALVRLTRSEPALARAVSEAKRESALNKLNVDRDEGARAERELRFCRLSEEEIAAIKAEALRIVKEGKRDTGLEGRLARYEVRAPLGGMVIARNAKVGQFVEPAAELFRITDLDRLSIRAALDQDDVKRLLARPP